MESNVESAEEPVPFNTMTTLSSSLNEGGYEYELLGVADSRYECPICLHCLKDPVLTTCGHRFCSNCISQWVVKEGKCPVDAVTLSVENIFPDNFTRREIMQCKAKCPFAKDGCQVSLCVSELERHVHSAHSTPPTNNNGQSSEGSRKISQGSLKSISGMVQCIYKDVGCASVFPVSQTEKHLETDVHHHLQLLSAAYRRLKVHSCRTAGGDYSVEPFARSDSRDSSRWLLENESLESLDDYQFRRQRSWDSVRFARRFNPRHVCHERLAESDESLCKSSDTAHKDCGNGDAHLRKLEGSGAAGDSINSAQLKDLFQRIVLLEQNDREKQIKIDRLESQLSSALSLFSSSTNIIKDLTARYCHGVFVWKISDFKKLAQDMRKNPNSILNSPGFYTDTFGYKLCLRLNITGPNSAVGASAVSPVDCPLEHDEDTFISLYVHFVRGEFDDTLHWPFQGELKLTVIHPSMPEDSICEIIYSKKETTAFDKPRLPRNPKGIGYPEFCPLSKLFSGGYLQNDTLVCKIFAKAY